MSTQAQKPGPTLVVYVDVDDTLVRNVGNKRIPAVATVEHVRALHRDGSRLYCWSSGGGDYAKLVAAELGIAMCFEAFLPKPHVIIDDQAIADWRRLLVIHPAECEAESASSYIAATGHHSEKIA